MDDGEAEDELFSIELLLDSGGALETELLLALEIELLFALERLLASADELDLALETLLAIAELLCTAANH